LLTAVTLLGAWFRLYRIDVLPPGETYDPAYYGLDALAILRGERPIFFETNFGREALFSYLVAAWVAVLGVGSQAIHVASAVVGILTIPVLYWAASELLSDEGGWLARFGGPIAALALALSFWHLTWSRYGVRAILLPLFAAGTVGAFWRGMRTQSRWAFAGCGALLGLSMYTYQAARLLPGVVILGYGALALWPRRAATGPGACVSGALRRDRGNLILLAAVALVVAAPLAIYFLQHPRGLTERIDQVFVLGEGQEGKLSALGRELSETLLVFGVRGDEKPTINLPGRPALSPFLFACFGLGIAVSLMSVRRPAYRVLLIWLVGMSVPGVLAQEGPTAKRIIGALPAVTILVAVGLLRPLDALRAWWARRPSRWRAVPLLLLAVAAAAGFVYSGIRTYSDYFVTWGRDPALFTHFEAGLAAIGQYIGGRPPGERIYVSPVYVGHPSIRYNSRERPGIRGYNGNFCFVLPARAERPISYLVVPGEDERSLGALSAHWPEGSVVDAGPLHYGRPYYLAYHVPAGAEAQVTPAYEHSASWGHKIALLGYDLDPPQPEGGSGLEVVLYYQGTAEMGTDYTVSVQLLGPQNPATGGPLWAQQDSEPCRRYRPTSSWAVGEVVIDRFRLDLPPEMPEGEYELIVGLYDWRTMERLPVLDAEGEAVDDHVVLVRMRMGE
jgi:4-amino-4-deoxy-L-arabinose transferase-like glycosyltransferase